MPIPVAFSIAGESPLAPSESTAAALCVDDGAADGSRDGAVTAGRQSAAGLLVGWETTESTNCMVLTLSVEPHKI